MVKLNTNKKIEASTLIEVTLALTIITIISGLAFMTLVSITKHANHELKTLAFIELENIVSKTKTSSILESEDFESNNIIIEQNVSDFGNCKHLSRVHYKVFSKQKELLFERFELIEVNPNEETVNMDDEFE